MTGFADPSVSRRVNFERCLWWRRDSGDQDLSELALRTKPSGSFTAREMSASSHTKKELEGAFLFDAGSATIATEDPVGAKPGDAVRFKGLIWAVADVQFREMRKRSAMTDGPVPGTTYLRLRR